MPKISLILLLAGVLFCSCSQEVDPDLVNSSYKPGPTPENIKLKIDEYKAANLDRFKALEATIDSLKQACPDIKLAKRLENFAQVKGEKGNAAATAALAKSGRIEIDEDSFNQPDEPGEDQIFDIMNTPFVDSYRPLRRVEVFFEEPYDSCSSCDEVYLKRIFADMDEILSLRYLILLDDSYQRQPYVQFSDKTFFPGEFSTTMMAFDLSTKKFLGWKRVYITNSETVTLVQYKGAALRQVIRNFAMNLVERFKGIRSDFEQKTYSHFIN